ncbi:hypothetical protein CPB83DRAFT_838416 [Crepidotus variabilis]|uniref:GST N-terminal domain-containing protein n=1 Tax=Crepidotus variabilis TaxID=179855 RepID=A0A9P6E9I7_9AGAR|nr:hypothetical protein CPB83DRAFT_838416 [Crepidotus variabilis]
MADSISPTQKIIFYDILCKRPLETTSPFTPVTHWSLKYKGLPFERKLIELADVMPLGEKLGFPKTMWPTGAVNTFPVIEDPNTGAKVSDSFDIAEYLDKTYADAARPLLVPQGTRTLQKAFLAAIWADQMPLFRFIVPLLHPKTTAYSSDYYVTSREAMFGDKLENLLPSGQEEVVEWAKVKRMFDNYETWFDEKEHKPYITGDAPVLADFYFAARLYLIRAALGPDSKQWADISSWNGGRWAAYLNNMLKEYPIEPNF